MTRRGTQGRCQRLIFIDIHASKLVGYRRVRVRNSEEHMRITLQHSILSWALRAATVGSAVVATQIPLSTASATDSKLALSLAKDEGSFLSTTAQRASNKGTKVNANNGVGNGL